MASQPQLQPSSRDCSQGLCTPYCRQWCYSLFPPPPPFQFAGAVEGDEDPPSSRAFSPLVIAIIAILASALLLLTYYTLVSRFCRRRRSRSSPPPADPADTSAPSHGPPSSAGLDEALISRMSVYRYRKDEGLVEGTDCSVCLSEFGHGQSLRLLPECTHAFHVDCIDTWLKSHSNCPICRAGVVWAGPAPPPPPPPQPPPSRPDGEAVAVVVDQDSSRQS